MPLPVVALRATGGHRSLPYGTIDARLLTNANTARRRIAPLRRQSIALADPGLAGDHGDGVPPVAPDPRRSGGRAARAKRYTGGHRAGAAGARAGQTSAGPT